ncbi:hypothetical protein DL89DRAFT_18947 [Linderina pennispora]|uniref:Uncharacterized protein n=1 Tax=Linderina pennispora TaxID=61395 RepID=A0A1Y1WLW9_9FUNG|nr:uncharacterized protein DL89DRAFT_18947 [Linderina pennispora]ORX74571.1 hypothetical protein DL89DRAFT_18947 [Linderina pennispora]
MCGRGRRWMCSDDLFPLGHLFYTAILTPAFVAVCTAHHAVGSTCYVFSHMAFIVRVLRLGVTWIYSSFGAALALFCTWRSLKQGASKRVSGSSVYPRQLLFRPSGLLWKCAIHSTALLQGTPALLSISCFGHFCFVGTCRLRVPDSCSDMLLHRCLLGERKEDCAWLLLCRKSRTIFSPMAFCSNAYILGNVRRKGDLHNVLFSVTLGTRGA